MLGTPKAKERAPAAPATLDLRSLFSPIDDQDGLGSCTAHAADSIFEFGERRAFGGYTEISRRFVYKVTRDLLGWTGDTGAYVRTTMGALVLFGTPPEKYWPYDVPNFDVEPPAFVYALAQNFRATAYFRYDVPGVTPRYAPPVGSSSTWQPVSLPCSDSPSTIVAYRQVNDKWWTDSIPSA